MTTPPDWWGQLYDPAGEQHDHPRTAAEPEPEPEPEEEKPAWWASMPVPPGFRRKDDDGQEEDEPPAAPTIQVTITQPSAAPRADHRRTARTRWLLIHAAAAAVGWLLGGVAALDAAMREAGQAGAAMGVGFILIGLLPAAYLPGLPYVPPALRPLITWAARIPCATAVLALALHTPGATL